MTLSYRDARLAGCTGKAIYTFIDAKKVVERSKGLVHAYKCKFCSSWHVGGNNNQMPKSKKRD